MKISIGNIKVQSISNIGSFNIGKTILSNNKATSTDISGPPGQQQTAQAGPDEQLVPPAQAAPSPSPSPSPSS
ncbi:hypothetical protein [Caldalkalibacillus salinus]|uniref:hypothetical protein n=1 Tax=Caldalkalibacillus salinus TaxID=2803787 RepID=UPI0019203EB8|nr:hypothetical protein [Caldalkalibacillus salinus]